MRAAEDIAETNGIRDHSSTWEHMFLLRGQISWSVGLRRVKCRLVGNLVNRVRLPVWEDAWKTSFLEDVSIGSRFLRIIRRKNRSFHDGLRSTCMLVNSVLFRDRTYRWVIVRSVRVRTSVTARFVCSFNYSVPQLFIAPRYALSIAMHAIAREQNIANVRT